MQIHKCNNTIKSGILSRTVIAYQCPIKDLLNRKKGSQLVRGGQRQRVQRDIDENT